MNLITKYTATITKKHKTTGEIVLVDLTGDKLKMVDSNGVIPTIYFNKMVEMTALHTDYIVISQTPKKIRDEINEIEPTQNDKDLDNYYAHRQKMTRVMGY